MIHDSAGLNLAMDYLPGSVNFDPVVHPVPADFASRVVWFDALVSNVDRTARNTNMLMWHRAPWLIDHGSTLYFHHTPGWEADPARPRAVFPAIKDHVLRRAASRIADLDEPMAAMLTPGVVNAVLACVPGDWLDEGREGRSVEAARVAYRQYLLKRLEPPRGFAEEASRAR